MRELEQMDLEWIVRRLPKDVSSMMWQANERMFLAGGFIRSVIANEKVNDVDLFTSKKEEAESWSRFLNVTKRKGGVSDLVLTDNAITVIGDPPVQFVHRWSFAKPEDCIESFDFTIAKAVVWWDNKVGKMGGWRSLCHDRFYSDLAAKRLVYTSPERQEEAGGSLLRVLKFYQRGYRIDVDSLGKVIARCAMGCSAIAGIMDEPVLAGYMRDRLREVDPAIDPSHMSHLPGEKGCDDEP